MTAVEFTYRSKKYYAIIRTKDSGDEKQHHVTVMNSDLENLICEHRTIIQKGDSFMADPNLRGKSTVELVNSIITALRDCLEHQSARDYHRQVADAD